MIQKTNDKNAYIIKRPVKFNGVLYKAGDKVIFKDKKIEKLFIKNNYVK